MKIEDICKNAGIGTRVYYRYAKRLGRRPTPKEVKRMADESRRRGPGRPRENLAEKYKY